MDSVNAYEDYMKQLIQPMRKELTEVGFQELRTPEEVDAFMEQAEGTSLVFINSMCGCAGGLARPAVRASLQNERLPDHLMTVFAGQDKEATAQMRSYFEGYEPSSPSVALLKGKGVVHFIPREDIEGEDLDEVTRHLVHAYDQFCS